MSECNNKSPLLIEKEVASILRTRPLGEFLFSMLSTEEIDERLLSRDKMQQSPDDELESAFDRLVNLIIGAISEAFDEINPIISDEGLIDSHVSVL
jgi:hypothetical protein